MGKKIDRKSVNMGPTLKCWAARPRHPKTRVTPRGVLGITRDKTEYTNEISLIPG